MRTVATLCANPDPTGTLCLDLDALRFGPQIRGGGLDEDHVRILMELKGEWPPILVWGGQNLVIDGAHRVCAARRLGLNSVMVDRFWGTAEEVYVEAVRRNVEHGLPLSLCDRMRAAERILEDHPEWSDRRISSVCAVGAKGVSRLRLERSASAEAPLPDPDTRIGMDGKIRPVHPAQARERALRALEDNPEGSLRLIAAVAGVSPETVRSVRKNLQGEAEIRPLLRVDEPPSVDSPVLLHSADDRPMGHWGEDPAFSSRAHGDQFAAWFEESTVGDEWRHYFDVVPVSRIYEIADEAQRRAACWSEFAQTLEARVQCSRAMRA
jgi:hypothetical protein